MAGQPEAKVQADMRIVESEVRRGGGYVCAGGRGDIYEGGDFGDLCCARGVLEQVGAWGVPVGSASWQ